MIQNPFDDHPLLAPSAESNIDQLLNLGHLQTDPELLRSYSQDRVSCALMPAGAARARFTPRSIAEVSEGVRWASNDRVPIVIRGAGSGLSGGCVALDGCLILDMSHMSETLDIDAGAMTATVGAGVINGDLKRAAARHGLWYAPDPASADFSTVGGNVATNAGGLCCVKYGVTRDALLNVQVVLADGSVQRFGRPTRKGVVGYDLASLICGSEGTLGVITEATVRLIPLPPSPITVIGHFPSLASTGQAIRAALQLQPSMLELLDRVTIDAIEKYQPMGFDSATKAVLLAQSDTGADVADRLAVAFEAAGAELVIRADDPAEGAMLLEGRRIAYTALEALGDTLLDDVSLPIDRISDFVAHIALIADEFDVQIATFGHAGDGNLHPTIITPRGDAVAAERSASAFDTVVQTALDLGGTITGEHGVGRLKYSYLERELGETLKWHRALRRTFDPDELFNPGRGI